MPNSKRPSNLNVAFKPLVAALMGLSASTVTALPTLDDASSLVGVAVGKNGDTLNVLQNQQNAVINWKDFSINKNQTVEFKADAGISNPLVINRVTGAQRSEILGSLQAEGFRFFLINPNGLVIGKDAQVNVGQLVAAATALPSVDAVNDFLNGDSANTLQLMVLDPSVATEVKAGADIKAQHITLIGQTVSNEAALNAGTVQLLGQNIENTGSITASAKVSLHNARELTASNEDGLLVFQVSQGFENALVRHLGTINLPGGTVSMIAGRNSGTGLSVLNTTGLVNASSLQVQGDTVTLVANSPGVSNIQALDSGTVQVQANQSLVVSGQAQSMDITLADGASTVSVNNTGSVALSAAELAAVNVEAGSLSLDALAVTGLTNLKVTGQAALRTQGDMKVSSEQTLNLQFEGKSLDVSAPTLNLSGTRAAGIVTLNVAGDSTIVSKTDLNLAGSTSNLDATAVGHVITIGDLDVKGDVALNAATISQTEAVNWVGKVGLAGGSAVLAKIDNTISGPVALQLDGDATLVNQPDVALQLAGQVKGNLTTTSTGLSQTAPLSVGKDATFTTPTINLQNASNQFGGNVTVVGASSVPISAASNITLFAADANQIDIEGAKVTLGSTAAELSSLTVVADELLQLQALTVKGITQLAVDKATLNDTGNKLEGAVQVNSRTAQGTAELNLSNSVATELQGGQVALSGDLQQGLVSKVDQLTIDALTVAGETTVTANSLKAGTGPSNFGGQLTLDVAGQAQVNSAENLQVTGKANSIDFTSAKSVAATNLTLAEGGQIKADHVAINAGADVDNPGVNTLNGLLEVNAGSLQVANNVALNLVFDGNTAEIAAPELTLTTTKADSRVNLDVAGSSKVDQQANLTLTGSTQALTVNGVGELTLATAVSSATVDTNSIVLAGFDSAETSSLKAQTITQIDGTALADRAALNLQNGINLQANNIALTVSGNSISGDITVNTLSAGAAQLDLNNSVNTSLKGGAVALSGKLQGLQADVQSLGVGPLEVIGAAFVKADSVSSSAGNNGQQISFSEGLQLDVANTAQFAVKGDLKLGGSTGSLVVDEANSLTLDGLSVAQATTLNSTLVEFNEFIGEGLVTVSAEDITQTGKVAFKQGGGLDAGTVTLNAPENEFLGLLKVQADTADIANSTKLEMTFDGGTANLEAPELLLSSVNATGPVSLKNVGQADITNGSKLTLTGNANTLNVNGTGELTLAASVGSATVDTNSIILAGFDSAETSSMKAQTITQIDGTDLAAREALNLQNGINLQADNIDLTLPGNSISGDITVNTLSAGAAQLDLNNSVNTSLKGGAVALSGNLQGLQADVQSLEVGPLEVNGAAFVKAESLSTNTQAGGNSIRFSEGLELDVTGQAQLAADADLALRGNVGSLQADVAGQLTFGQFTAQGDTDITADAINQTGAITLLQGGSLQAQSVALDDTANSIDGLLEVQANSATIVNSKLLEMTFNGAKAQIQAPELVLSDVSATDAVELNVLGKSAITQSNDLTLTGSTESLELSGKGELTLAVEVNTAQVTTDQITVAGFKSASSSTLTAQSITQIDGTALAGRQGVLTQNGLHLIADDINLGATGNQLSGELLVNSLTPSTTVSFLLNNSVNTDLKGDAVALAGNLNGLNAEVQSLEIGPLAVEGSAFVKADDLSTSQQADGKQISFSEGLQLDVANQAQFAVEGNLSLSGKAGSLVVDEANTLALENLTVQQTTSLDSTSLVFNQFTGEGAVKATAGSISQTGVVNFNNGGELSAQSVQLTNGGNAISGVLEVKADTASVANASKLEMTFNGGTATINAPELVLSSVNATGPVTLQNVGQANVTNSGNLTLAGTAGNLVSTGQGNLTLGTSVATADVSASSIVLNGYASTGASKFNAGSISQTSNATVGGALDLSGGTVDLAASGNSFNGVVTLANTGNAAVSSANLNAQGSVGGNANLLAGNNLQLGALNVGGNTTLTAGVIGQSNALNVGGATTATGSTIILDNASNQLGSAVVLNNAQLARIRNSGNLVVSGQQLNTLEFTAPTVVLGDLGQIQQIEVNTGELSQTAALNVLGDARFRTNQITLDNPDNQFGGAFEILPTAGEINESGEFVDPPIFTMLSVASSKDLKLSGNNIELSATVKGALDVQANNLLLADLDVQGPINAVAQGTVGQTQALTLGKARIEGSEITLENATNDFTDVLTLARASLSTVRDANDLQLDVNQVNGAVQVQTGGNAQVIGSTLTLKNTQIQGNADIRADRIAQDGALMVGGQAEIRAAEQIDLQNTGNVFSGDVLLVGNDVRLHDSTDLTVANMFSRGGQLSSAGQIELKGDVLQDGGEMRFIAQGKAEPLSRERLAELLNDGLDVYSAKEAVDPITGQIVLTIAAPAIVQTGGQIVTTQGSVTFMQSTEGASIFLNQNNRITGQLNALAGAQRGQAFAFDPTKGASLVSVRNTTGLLVGAPGLEADMVAIQARGLATAPGGVIRARMPYNNLAVGAARSYPGLLLSIPVNRDNLAGGGAVLPFGSGNLGGGIQVEIGPQDNPALGGFVSVLPFEGRSLLPGQIVFLEGPVNSGAYRFFYDGARDLGRIPISFNGSILLSPQESSALSTVLGIAVSAREQQTQSVVRTENVERKVFNGVIAEAGPGRPATEGDGELSKPDNCEPEEGSLACEK